MTFTASIHQKNTDPDDWNIPGTKMANTGPFLWNVSSEIQFFTDTYLFYLRYWGKPMLFFQKLVDETQMSKPPGAPRHQNDQ